MKNSKSNKTLKKFYSKNFLINSALVFLMFSGCKTSISYAYDYWIDTYQTEKVLHRLSHGYKKVFYKRNGKTIEIKYFDGNWTELTCMIGGEVFSEYYNRCLPWEIVEENQKIRIKNAENKF